MVDLPEPVLPMMAVIWPRRRRGRDRAVSSEACESESLRDQRAISSLWGRVVTLVAGSRMKRSYV